MSGSLISPGVKLQLSNETSYAGSGPGTVPFIMMATAENKIQPGSSASIAPGTIKQNAGKLNLITGQRELVQTFGNPKFYTQAGTPQNGNELNEYGLYAAYQYLGIANSAYVMRADIDLASLEPSSTAPVGLPSNGDYWLDLNNTNWGIFRSNGNPNSSLAWSAVNPLVIDSSIALERYAEGNSQYQIIDPNSSLTSNSTYAYGSGYQLRGEIFGIEVSVANGQTVRVDVNYPNPTTLVTLANAITSNTKLKKMGISAEVIRKEEILTSTGKPSTVYNLRIISTDINKQLSFYTNTNNNTQIDNNEDLIALGFGISDVSTAGYTENIIAPKGSIGSLGDIAVNTVGYMSAFDVNNTNDVQQVVKNGIQLLEKVAVISDSGVSERWYPINSTQWRMAQPTKLNATGAIQVTSSAITPALIGNVYVAIGNSQYYSFLVNNKDDVSTVVGNINLLLSNNGLNAVASTYHSNKGSIIKIINYDGTNITLVDDASGLALKYIGFSSNSTISMGTNAIQTDATYTLPQNVTQANITLTVGNSKSSYSFPRNQSGTIGEPQDVINGINQNFMGGNSFASIINLIDQTGGPNTQHTVINNVSGDISFTDNSSGGISTILSLDNFSSLQAVVAYGNSITYQGYTNTSPQPDNSKILGVQTSGNIWINTNPLNRGVKLSFKRYSITSGTWQSVSVSMYGPGLNMAGQPVIGGDFAKQAFNNTINLNSVFADYYSDDLTSNYSPSTAMVPAVQNITNYMSASPNIQLKIWNGSDWEQVAVNHTYSQSKTTPVGKTPEDSLWYNTNLKVDIMVGDGEKWWGYSNFPGNKGLDGNPVTDPNGPILSGSAPSYQSDGETPLANNDIWIDTSDLENYPKIYRWDGVNYVWNLIDNTDNFSSAGIIFADARQDDGSDLNLTTPSAMAGSDYLDSDAPSALPYPYGMLLFNTRYSTYNVKRWKSAYLPNPQWDNTSPANVARYVGRWVTASGNMKNNAPYMGRNAQRVMVTNAMNAAIESSQEVRSDTNFFNLIAAPGYIEVLPELIKLNSDIQNIAFVLADVPARITPDGTSINGWAKNTNKAAVNGDEGLISSSPYVGLYYPWGLATNLDGNNIFVPPTTAALVTYAFNDQVSYPWFAPAGFTRGLVSVFSSVGYLDSNGTYIPTTLSQGQRDILYSNKINPIAYIVGRGLVIYGQITLDPNSTAMSRVNVSRLVNYLNYYLNLLAKPFLFQPNDEHTRQSVSTTFTNYMSNLVNKRAVYDFAILCDSSNNLPETIAMNQLYVSVAIKPEITLEFIYIPLILVDQNVPLRSSSATTA